MANTTSVDLQAVIEKRVADMVTTTLIQNSVSLGVVSMHSVSNGMDQLRIPLYNSLAVQTVSESADLSTEALAPTEAQLDLDRQRGIAWSITKRAQVQAKIDSVTQAVKNGSRELASEVDDFVFGAMALNGGNDITIVAQSPLELIAEAKKNMDSANVQRFDRFIVAGPGFIQALLGDNNVINVDKYGSANPIQAGFVSRIYGFTIVESSSTAIPASGFIACQKEAFAFARQINPMLLKEEKALGVKDDYSLTHLYGGVLTDAGSDRIIVASA